MRVKELIEYLQQANPESEAVIPLTPSRHVMGCQPYLVVDWVWEGFDWETGKVFIQPKERIAVVGGQDSEPGQEDIDE